MSANFQKLQALYRAGKDKADSRMAAMDKADLDYAASLSCTDMSVTASRRAREVKMVVPAFAETTTRTTSPAMDAWVVMAAGAMASVGHCGGGGGPR